MVTSNSSAIQLERNLHRFFIVLTSAACEWFLLFWLLIEAILSFLLKKFASYCKLQIPCIFCSRLDYILEKENPGFYQGLLCNNHKLKLSSLLSCGSNGKLVSSHDICEECRLSSARTSMPNHFLMYKSGRMHHGKKMRGKFSGSVSRNHLKKFGFDHLSHTGYSELKISSDPESDFPISDDDDGKSIIREKKVPIFDPSSRSSCDVPHDMKSAVTDHKNDVSEKKYEEDDKKSCRSSIPELISLDDFPPLCNAMEDSNGSSLKKCELKFPLSQNLSSSAALSELMSLIDAPPSINFTEFGPNPLPTKSNGSITIDGKSTEANVQDKSLKSVIPDNKNLNDSWHPTINSIGNDSYEFMEEKLDSKGCDSIEEAKTLPSGNTIAQGILYYPKLLSQECESKAIEDSFSDGVQNALSINKIESDSALSLSVDESIISEIEGESTIIHLKRQIEEYKTKISALYVELEEERSASAVAANQAMAMITRLQEEKALLHMEALQYLRMMEEQAEHDVEALEKANDLLAEREKDIQDLEAELEILRIKYLEEAAATDFTQEKTFDLHRNSKIAMDTGICEKDGVKASNCLMFRKVSNVNEEPFASKSPLTEFGNEKLFISQCLRDLERKLVELGCQQDSLSTFDDDIGEKIDTKVREKQFERKEESEKTDAELNDVDLSLQKKITSNGSCQEEENCISSNEKDQDVRNNEELSPFNGHNLCRKDEKIDLVTLSNEISDLNERLEALETDWNFLEHTLNSLETGKEGVHFVREISHHLQELRKNCMS